MWDVWFGRDANYFNIKSTPNDSYSIIDAPREAVTSPRVLFKESFPETLLTVYVYVQCRSEN